MRPRSILIEERARRLVNQYPLTIVKCTKPSTQSIFHYYYYYYYYDYLSIHTEVIQIQIVLLPIPNNHIFATPYHLARWC